MTDEDIQAELAKYLSNALDGNGKGRRTGKLKDNALILAGFAENGAKNLEHISMYKADPSYTLKKAFWFYQNGDGNWELMAQHSGHPIATEPFVCGPKIDTVALAITKLIELSESNEQVQTSILNASRYKRKGDPKPTLTMRQLIYPAYTGLLKKVGIAETSTAPKVAPAKALDKAPAEA